MERKPENDRNNVAYCKKRRENTVIKEKEEKMLKTTTKVLMTEDRQKHTTEEDEGKTWSQVAGEDVQRKPNNEYNLNKTTKIRL